MQPKPNPHLNPPGITTPSRRTITNSTMRDKIQVLKYGIETNGAYSSALMWCQPHGGPPMHYHRSYSERFTAISGNLVVYRDDQKLVLKPGDSATVDVGHAHRFTAEGDEEVHFKGEVFPSHPGFERAMYIMYGLANDGLGDEEGLPRSAVQKALVADMSDMRFVGGAGAWVANVAVKILACWGRWSGEEERLLRRYWD